MSRTISVDGYSVLCDAIERAWMNLPVEREVDEPPAFYTSSYARAAANRIVDELGLEIDL